MARYLVFAVGAYIAVLYGLFFLRYDVLYRYAVYATTFQGNFSCVYLWKLLVIRRSDNYFFSLRYALLLIKCLWIAVRLLTTYFCLGWCRFQLFSVVVCSAYGIYCLCYFASVIITLLVLWFFLLHGWFCCVRLFFYCSVKLYDWFGSGYWSDWRLWKWGGEGVSGFGHIVAWK